MSLASKEHEAALMDVLDELHHEVDALADAVVKAVGEVPSLLLARAHCCIADAASLLAQHRRNLLNAKRDRERR